MAPPPDPSSTDADRAAVLDGTAQSLGLVIADEWRDEILAHMKVIAAAAQALNEFPLDEEIEPAAVFRP
jgi:hypothetical protein